MNDDPLDRLAALCGIDERYRDAWGNWRTVSRTTRAALLTALGYDVSTPAMQAESLHGRMCETWRRPLSPLTVIRAAAGEMQVLLSAPAEMSGRARWTIRREDGDTLDGDIDLAALPVAETGDIDGRAFVRRVLTVPAMPLGYHRMSLALPGIEREAETTVIVAPDRCFVPNALAAGGRIWGIATQLYAARSARSWGAGDFGDLRRLIELVAEAGGGVVGVNPLHALHAGRPDHCSPYAPSSRLGLNVLYIDVEAVPEFGECEAAQRVVADDAFRDALARLRTTRLVDYVGLAQRKFAVLHTLYERFRARHLDGGDRPTERGRAFRRFQAEDDTRRRLAIFEVLAEKAGRDGVASYNWRAWPEHFRDPASPHVSSFAAENRQRVEFHEYLQWVARGQLDDCSARARSLGMTVGLYVDLALGADSDGADAWGLQHVLARAVSAGAPPDQLNLKGQDWGFAPFHPEALREAAYAPFIAMLRHNMRDAGAIRIDHVLGLRRLYWVPWGAGAADGGYVRYPFEELVAIIALESVRNRCMVIGEDLGTLPEGLRERLQDAALLSYRVLAFEREDNGDFRQPDDYPRLALVAGSTHDLPTVPAFWRGDDIELRRQLDLFPSERESMEASQARAEERRQLLEALERAGIDAGSVVDPNTDGVDPPLTLIEAIHRFLARTPSMLLMAQFEDLIGETAPINVPGTSLEYPNWRRALSLTIEEIARDPRVRSVLAAIAAERAGEVAPEEPRR